MIIQKWSVLNNSQILQLQGMTILYEMYLKRIKKLVFGITLILIKSPFSYIALICSKSLPVGIKIYLFESLKVWFLITSTGICVFSLLFVIFHGTHMFNIR